MRWPFGPPHLTLKPSKKNKEKKQQNKANKKTNKKQQHPTTKPRTKQTKQKQKQHKKKQTQETQKHLNLSNPDEQQWATPEKPQKLGKTSIFNTFQTMPDTPKTNLLILKPPKKQTPKKHHFAMFKNNPLFFMNFLFFQHRVFVFEKLCFAENTIKIVFSGNTAFQKHS